MNEEDDMRPDSLDSEKSDLDTEDEDSDGGFAPAPMPSQSSHSQARSQVSIGARAKTSETANSDEARTAPTKSPEIELPPRRQLPFSRGNATSASQVQPKATAPLSKPLPTMVDDDETDDEL